MLTAPSALGRRIKKVNGDLVLRPKLMNIPIGLGINIVVLMAGNTS